VELLDVPYFHVVFTVPVEIEVTAFQNQTVVLHRLGYWHLTVNAKINTNPEGPFMNDPTGLADKIRCDSTEEGAALGLLALMTGISEEYWHVDWHIGLEYNLWRLREEGSPNAFPITERRVYLTDRQVSLLQLLSEECDGWWTWRVDGPRFMSKTEWMEWLTSNPGDT
jgi:hypothetical protein